ncbi:hypothetical protein FRC07_004423 [Ceratobasidium sp. 392]|nr:hypothetical protein FRC07_004423 [Ceratobasidium sp. 392]
MGVLALGALGAMLPGVLSPAVDTRSLVVATVVVAVVLILAYVTNPSPASFRTFLTELAFRRHLSKLHDASDAESPSLHWARHSHQLDAAPHLQFATRASVSVRSSAHIFRSFGILTIAAVTPVGDHRAGAKSAGSPAPANAFASDHGRWFLGAFGKWWLGGTLLLGKGDDAHATAGLLDIRLLDDSELLKWKVVPEIPVSRTPPPLPKHASLPLHTNAKQQKQSSPKRKPKSKLENSSVPSTTVTSNAPATSGPNPNIDAHPLIADLLQHIATTQATLTSTRAQLAQLHESTTQTREQTEEHAAQRAKQNSTSAVSDAAKTHTHQLTNAQEIAGVGEEKEVMGLAGKVRALEAEVREARKTLEELREWQASLTQDGDIDEQGELIRDTEHEKEKEPGVVYIGQTPVRAPSLSNASQASFLLFYQKFSALTRPLQTNPARIHNPIVPHTRTASVPASGLLSHAIHTPVQSQNGPATPVSTVTNSGYSPTPANAVVDVASPARSARNKGYAIFDPDLAGLGAPKGIQSPIAKGANGPDSSQPSSNPSPGSTHQVAAVTRPAFSPFDSDTLPIAIPKRTGGNYALVSDEALNGNGTKFGPAKFDVFGLGMDSPTTGVFSPPPSALLPSSLFSEDGHGHQRWDGESESDGTANGQLTNSTSPGQLMGSHFGSSPGHWANGTSPGQWSANGTGTSPARWEKDADGWVNEAKSVSQGTTNGWDKPGKDSNWINELDGWAGGESRRRWTSESSTNGVWAPRAEGGRPRSLSVESGFDGPVGRPRSDSHDGHRLSSGADSGYHTATNHSHPKKRHSGSSSGEDVAQDNYSFAPPFLQHSPVSVNADSSISSFGQGVFGPSSHLSTRRGFDAQRVSLPTRVPLIREVEEPEPAQPATETAVVTSSTPKSRRWFGAKKDEGNARASVAAQASGLNPDAKVFSFSPDASKMFNFTRGRTFSMAPPAPASVEPAPSFSSLSLGSANSSSVALGNGGSSGGSASFFSSLLAFAPSPAEREALQRALGTNGITRTLSNTSARSPFTSPLASARSSVVDLSDKAALAWGNGESVTPIVQKRTWFPVRKKAAVEETE